MPFTSHEFPCQLSRMADGRGVKRYACALVCNSLEGAPPAFISGKCLQSAARDCFDSTGSAL